MTLSSVQVKRESLEGLQARDALISTCVGPVVRLGAREREGRWNSSYRILLNLCVFGIGGQIFEQQ